MDKAYNLLLFENEPSVKTPIDEINLNNITKGLNTVDDRVIALNNIKLDKTTANSMTKDFTIDVKTGIITETKLDGTVTTWDLNLEKIPVSMYMTSDAVLVLRTDDGEQYSADLKGLIDTYVFVNSDTVVFNMTTVDGLKSVTAAIRAGSITGDMLDPDYLAQIIQSVNTAQSYAQSADTSAALSKRWAVGDRANYPESITDNSKYYAEQAQKAAALAENTVNLNLPHFEVNSNNMHLMGTFEKKFTFVLSNGHLKVGIGV